MIAYRKLPHGPWGILTDDPSLKPGQQVTVRTKSGKDKIETLALHHYSVSGLHVFELAPRNAFAGESKHDFDGDTESERRVGRYAS